jgi:glycosyltransferase involved in cell wall biosynthesis
VKILIISWYYPPWNETASNRPYSWARHFARQGHTVTVLTSVKDPELHPDLSTPLEPHPNLTVLETPLRLKRTRIAKGASWAAGSIRQVRRLARGHDFVISTFMPWYVHVLGRVAKAANPRCTWCADYRDLWHDYDFFTAASPLRRTGLRLFERAVVHAADLLTTVSPPLADRLKRTHPHLPTATVYNGFPASEYCPTTPETRLAERRRDGRPFQILYAGTLYEGYHDPEPLFQALAKRRDERPVKLFFYGRSARSPLVRTLRDKYRLHSTVETPETCLSRAACFQLQQESDLLLHLGWTNQEMDGVLSAKVFEYMASGTPVLSVGAGPSTAIGRLLEETGTGICVGRDVAPIEASLEVMSVRGRHPAWFRPNRERIMTYTRETQADRLLELLNEVRRAKSGSHHAGAEAAATSGNLP